MSKTIWILNHYAIPPNMPGGTRHYDLSQELIKKGYEVTIFSSGFSHFQKNHFKLFKGKQYIVENYGKLKFVWLMTTSYKKNNYKRIINMFSYLTKILKVAHKFPKPNVIVGSSVHPLAVVAAWWLARRYKARFIFEVRDLWPQTPIDMKILNANSITAKLLYGWEKFMYKRADKIIVLLPNAKEYIEKYGIDSQKIVWIPNGVDLELFDKPEYIDPSSEIAKVFRKKKNRFKVVYAGAHGPVNALETVIDAAYLLAKKSANIHFFLIGDGSEKKKLINKAQEKSVYNITFLDPVTKFQVPAILQKSDLLIFCLRNLNIYKYGISFNKMHDYFASGKPVLMAGDIFNNIIQEAGAGITVESENPEALAQGILKIEKMTLEERQKLGANGRAYVEKYHNTRMLADILEKIL